MILKDKIVRIQDFPIKGVLFRDLSYIYHDYQTFRYCRNEIYKHILSLLPSCYDPTKIKIVAPESRGFIIAGAVADYAGRSFVMARKPGKIKNPLSCEYSTEYSKTILEIDPKLINKHDEIIIIDDVLATGGTMRAIYNMLISIGASVTCGIAICGLKEFKNQWSNLPFTTHVLFED